MNSRRKKEPVATDSSPRGLALARCDKLIEWYTNEGRRQRIAFQSFQVAAILLSGITPILVLWLPDCWDAWAALPATLAAIATGLLGIFQWKENYIRFAYTGEALKSERIKFITRTTKPYDSALEDKAALSRFVTRMEALVMTEVTDWRGLMQEAAKDGDQAQGTLANSSAPPPPETQPDPKKESPPG